MLEAYLVHNYFKENTDAFIEMDPHLLALSKLRYQYHPCWWAALSLKTPGIYILTGGRQVGKSTSCKLLIAECLQQQYFDSRNIFYLPCDEIFDAKALSQTIRFFLNHLQEGPFLLLIDEITYVPHWERVIKALADEGWFARGFCLLTGSDTLILKEAAMSFPGRRGESDQTDFHLYPLSFYEYVTLVADQSSQLEPLMLRNLYQQYLHCGGYLRAINDFAEYGHVKAATFRTYQEWIRGDFLKKGKNEAYLLAVLNALLTTGISQVSYSGLTQKIGLMSKETCIEYCHLLERMDVLVTLQAFDQNKRQGFPRKARKFHFFDPFIQRSIQSWLKQNGYIDKNSFAPEMVESTVATHCFRYGRAFYFKGQGEVDVIWLNNGTVEAVEVKWTEQVRPMDLKMLKQFHRGYLLGKQPQASRQGGLSIMSVYEYLYHLGKTNI